VSEEASISVSKCEIEFLRDPKPYRGRPVGDRKEGLDQTGTLTTFRITSSDEMNLIAGLIEWESAEPEVVPIDLISGLNKHSELKNRGRMSIKHSRDGNWLVVLSVMKYNPSKQYFTLHGGVLEDIDEYLGHSFKDFLMGSGALRFGTRGEIDGETSRTESQLAVVIKPGDIETLAIAYTVTRPLAVINDYGLSAT
jgi:hypothetical protein